MKLVYFILWALFSVSTLFAGGKTLRVEHGRPVVLVSQQSVLVLEFIKEGAQEAAVRLDEDTRSCQANYHYQLFDGATDSIKFGKGTVAEILRTIGRSSNGTRVEDAGSHTSIQVGEFHLNWSEATAGSRSWLYYTADSAVRFIQQPKSLDFDRIGTGQLRQYFGSRNVQEFSSAGQEVMVIGPAIFVGDFPDETPISARIESIGIESGVFRIKIIGLIPGKNYVIESGYELKTKNWNVVHTFGGLEPTHTWKDPLGKETTTLFYRVREGN